MRLFAARFTQRVEQFFVQRFIPQTAVVAFNDRDLRGNADVAETAGRFAAGAPKRFRLFPTKHRKLMVQWAQGMRVMPLSYMEYFEDGDLERVTRIELVTKAWEAAVIPFHHTRRRLDR